VKFNISYNKILSWLSLSFIAGVGIASYWNMPALFVLFLAALAVFLFLLGWFKDKKRAFVVAFLCMGALLGILRFSLMNQGASGQKMIQNWNGQKVVLSGIVKDEPQERADKTYLVFEAEKLISSIPNLDVGGKVRVKINRFLEFQMGDKIKISGSLEKPKNFSGFDYESYLAKDGIYSVMNDAQIEKIGVSKMSFVQRELFVAKNKLIDSLQRSLPEPESSFVSGILLGAKQNMPQKLIEDFNNTSTTHLIALSGFNITIIANFIQNTARFFSFSAGWSFFSAILGITIFTIGTGASASVVRAAIMGVVSLIALRSGRVYNNKFALLFAGALMVAIWPSLLRFDLGFQLSFLATLGLVYFSDFFNQKLKCLTNFFALRENLATTLAAQIFVLPLLIINFQKISFVSPIVNVLVLPLIPYTMLTGFLGGAVGIVSPALGFIINLPTWLMASFTLNVISFFASWPIAVWNMSFGTSQILGSAVLFIVILIFIWRASYSVSSTEK
jgi:competence protein ComEC